MKVLVVDGFDSTPSGRRNFKDFFDGVKYAFESETNHSVSEKRATSKDRPAFFAYNFSSIVPF